MTTEPPQPNASRSRAHDADLQAESHVSIRHRPCARQPHAPVSQSHERAHARSCDARPAQEFERDLKDHTVQVQQKLAYILAALDEPIAAR